MQNFPRPYITVFCGLLLSLLICGQAANALPVYAQKEQKQCSYCHASGTPGTKDPVTGEKQPATLNSRGDYYAAHDHTFNGYKIEINAPKAAPAMAFKFLWKEEFTDLPRRIGVGDVTGDGTPRLVMLHEKLDNKNGFRPDGAKMGWQNVRERIRGRNASPRRTNCKLGNSRARVIPP